MGQQDLVLPSGEGISDFHYLSHRSVGAAGPIGTTDDPVLGERLPGHDLLQLQRETTQPH